MNTLHTRRLSAFLLVGTVLAVPGTSVAGTVQLSASAAFAGSKGLEVSIFPGCTGDVDVTIAPGPFSGSVEACRFVHATDVDIVSPGATLLAGRSANLAEFSVSDTLFEAAVAPSLDPFAYVFDESPAAEVTYNASFALRADGLTMGAGDRLEHFNGYSADGTAWVRVIITHTGGSNRLSLAVRRDDGTEEESPELLLPTGWNQIDLSWEASTSSTIELLINGIGTQLTGVDNASGRIDSVRWGAVDGTVGGTSGILGLDEFTSSR